MNNPPLVTDSPIRAIRRVDKRNIDLVTRSVTVQFRCCRRFPDCLCIVVRFLEDIGDPALAPKLEFLMVVLSNEELLQLFEPRLDAFSSELALVQKRLQLFALLGRLREDDVLVLVFLGLPEGVVFREVSDEPLWG